MARRAQKLIALIFMIATLASVVVIAYSLENYVGVSLAIRSMSTFVAGFNVELVDEGNIRVTTDMIVNNTSPYQFSVKSFEEQVYINETYAGTTRVVFPQASALLIQPHSLTNYTLELNLHLDYLEPELVEWLLDSAIAKSWFANIVVFCDGPLIGGFQLFTSITREEF